MWCRCMGRCRVALSCYPNPGPHPAIAPFGMRWTPGSGSDIEDRRGSSGGGFGIGGAPIGCGGAIILLVLSLLFHKNFFALLGSGDNGTQVSGPAAQSRPVQETPEEHKEVQFVSFVLDDVQKTWPTILAQ